MRGVGSNGLVGDGQEPDDARIRRAPRKLHRSQHEPMTVPEGASGAAGRGCQIGNGQQIDGMDGGRPGWQPQ